MKKEEEKYPILGKAWFADIEALCTWYKTNARQWFEDIWDDIRSIEDSAIARLLGKCRDVQKIAHSMGIWFEENAINRGIESIQHISEYILKYGMPMELLYSDMKMAVVQYGINRLLLPGEFLRIELFKDYSQLTAPQLKALGSPLSDTGLIPSTGMQNASRSDLDKTLADHQMKVQALEAECREIKSGDHKEIADLKAELIKMEAALEAKKAHMLAMREEMMSKMLAMQKEMEMKIFILDSEIYSIRCYLGEVVEFGCIRDGRPASPERPVVLFQKVRYLDEELGQLASIYDIDDGKYGIIEEFLRHSDVALDRFCPSEKCIVLLRVSRDGRVFGAHEKYSNMLQEYEFYHGGRICILIRNGDRLYAGWTDEERVNVPEDMFYVPKEMAPEPAVVVNEEDDYETRRDKEHKLHNDENQRKRSLYDMVSRYFIFSILQGVLERKEILNIPEAVSITKSFAQPNPYIIFSAAENWLEDNRFGAFTELVARCNNSVIVGDMILTLQHLCPDMEDRYKRFKNDRGRGESNRIHDVDAKDATIYQVNRVEYSEKYRRITYRYQSSIGKGKMYTTTTRVKIGEDPTFSPGTEILSDVITHDVKIYISLEKSLSYDARANFQVRSGEFINLTYMNSSWLLYAINSKKLGGWLIGHEEVNYAYAIRYLNKALEFVRKREEEEKDLITEHYLKLNTITDWPALLSEWKLEKKVRAITPYQAARFARWLSEKER